MPKVKTTERQKMEMQAEYESGALNNREIAEKYNVGESYIRKLAKQENWQKGKEKEYYDAKKIAVEKEILAKCKSDDKEYQIITKISTEAEKHGKEIAETKLSIEARQTKATEQGYEILNGYLGELLDVISNSKASSEAVETFEYDEKGNLETKRIVSKASKYKIINETKAIELLKGLGILQSLPSVAIQNNNTNAQQNNNTDIKVETQFSKISEQEAFQEFCKKIGK